MGVFNFVSGIVCILGGIMTFLIGIGVWGSPSLNAMEPGRSKRLKKQLCLMSPIITAFGILLLFGIL